LLEGSCRSAYFSSVFHKPAAASVHGPQHIPCDIGPVLNSYLRRIPVEPPLTNGCVLRSPAWRLDHGTNPSERENR
jgi:hypothetical protein